jgi:hypothetical protein
MTTRRRLLLILAVVGAIKLAAVGFYLGISPASACAAVAICGILVAIYRSNVPSKSEANDTAGDGR